MKNFAHYNSRHRKSNLSPDRPGNLEGINVPWTITTFFFLIIDARICHGEIRAKMLRKQVWGSDVRHRRWAHRLHILQGLKTNTFCRCLYWSSVVKVKLCRKAKHRESLRDNCTDLDFFFRLSATYLCLSFPVESFVSAWNDRKLSGLWFCLSSSSLVVFCSLCRHFPLRCASVVIFWAKNTALYIIVWIKQSLDSNKVPQP